MKTAYLFTGQGFQYEGMLKTIPSCSLTENMLKTAANTLEEDILSLDSREALKNNRNVQLCIYIYEVIFGQLQFESLVPDYVAGHSIGAFSAATAAGALEFEEGLLLVNERGRAMEEGYTSGYGMLSTMGLTFEMLEENVKNFNENYDERNQVYIACINSKDQIVLSGLQGTLNQVDKYLKNQYPIKTQFLNVKVPSHCELMLHVSNILKEKMKDITLSKPRIPYIMNTTARKTRQADMIKKDLVYGVSKPVQWYDIVSLLYELEVKKFLEIGGNNVLTSIEGKYYNDIVWQS